jgi:hypothetical protein
MGKEKRGRGQPTKYRPEYCDLLIEHMRQGLSFESFAAIVGTHKQTLYNWCDARPEFLDAKKRATELCRLWWEKAGLGGMYMGGKDNPFNATVWLFNMKNRFGWRDKQEIEQKGSQTVHIQIDGEDAKL